MFENRPYPAGPGRQVVAPARGAAALAVLAVAWLLQAGCAANRFERPRPGTVQRGLASWYGEPFHGRATASGEIYDMHGLTAAHKELPLGTVIDVTNLENGRQLRLRINDRGPFIRGRVLDLSYAAAKQLGVVGPGTAKVEIRVVEVGRGRSGPKTTTRYTVQMGAFRERTNAVALERRVARHRGDARVVETDGWYRVRVGEFRSQTAAEEVRRELQRHGFQALVVGLN